MGSNPGVAKKKISHRPNQNNTTFNPSAPELNTWNCQRWKPKVTVAQWKRAGLEIQRSWVQTPVWPKRKSFTGPIRTIPPPIPLYRFEYMKLSEVKNRSYRGAVVECRIRDPEVMGSNPGVAKKKISHRSNKNNTTTNPPCTRGKYLKLSEVKTRSHDGTVVECRTRDQEVLGSNPSVVKKKISQNQNNTITNHSTPELNTWNCQRWKPEVAVPQW